jgi:hypothetical protein
MTPRHAQDIFRTVKIKKTEALFKKSRSGGK